MHENHFLFPCFVVFVFTQKVMGSFPVFQLVYLVCTLMLLCMLKVA